MQQLHGVDAVEFVGVPEVLVHAGVDDLKLVFEHPEQCRLDLVASHVPVSLR
jgi:hypothetical protein